MRLIRAGLSALFLIVQFHSLAQDGLGDSLRDSLKDLPVLSLPISGRKLVIAHCMTNIIRFKGHRLEDSCDPEFYPSSDSVTGSLGGLTQVKVLEDPVLKDASLDQAVEFEMRAAIRSGIDGFQFYYTLGNDSWDEIIRAYLRVATQKKIDFTFTFCISHPAGGLEKNKVAAFAGRINRIMDDAGRDNPHWLRTPDGRLVLYMWYGEQMADIPADLKGLPRAFYEARAFSRLGASIHEKLACVYTINENISQERLVNVLHYFPAVWVWTLPYSVLYPGARIAATCRAMHRTFTGSVFGDFYTSKLLKRGTWDMYHSAHDAVAAGIGNVERKYITTGLSYNFRKLWEFAIQQDVPIVNVITWNDYPEGHHLAPEANHNDGFAQLLLYYKQVWVHGGGAGEGGGLGNSGVLGDDRDSGKGGVLGNGGKEVAVVFFKKYKHDVVPSPYYIPVVPFQEETIPAVWEDSIEVVTILKAPATLVVNGHSVPVPEGLQATRFPSQPGAVAVEVTRGDVAFIRFNTPEGITNTPYRSDRLTYTISSDYPQFYKDIFGTRPMISSTVYGQREHAAQ